MTRAGSKDYAMSEFIHAVVQRNDFNPND